MSILIKIERIEIWLKYISNLIFNKKYILIIIMKLTPVENNNIKFENN